MKSRHGGKVLTSSWQSDTPKTLWIRVPSDAFSNISRNAVLR
jgi:hypothetical protein